MRLVDDDIDAAHHVVLVGLLEVLHVELGVDLALEATLLAFEAGLGLQVVAQLAEAAARIFTHMVVGLYATRHQHLLLDGCRGHHQRSLRHPACHNVVAVAGTIDAVARFCDVGSCSATSLLCDGHGLQRVARERVDDVHIVGALVASVVLRHIYLNGSVTIAALGISVADLAIVVVAETNSPLSVVLHF